MSWIDQLRGWLRRESHDVAAATRDLERRLDADLSARERQLDETPQEGLERMQREIAGHDDAFDDIRRKANRRRSAGEAAADLDPPGPDLPDDIQ
ncbi:MAG: hypothetical protein ACK5RL_18020 [Acidimicrobiales bacterium]